MGLFGQFTDLFRSAKQNTVLSSFLTLINPMTMGGQIGDMSAQQAQTISAVYSAVHVYSDTISTLGLHLFQGDCEATLKKATGHPLYEILHGEPNEEQTAQQALAYLVASLFLKGNAYAQIVRTNGGKVVSLVPLDPDYVFPRRVKGKIVYDITSKALGTIASSPLANEIDTTLDAADMVHVYLNYNPRVLRGVSPVAYARNAIGLGLALDNFALSFFSNGATPKIMLEVPGSVTKEQADALLQKFNAQNAGLENANKTGMTTGGIKVHQLTLAPDECQFLESRKYTVDEIARWFSLPAHKIGGGSGKSGTYSNKEQDSLEFVQHSIRPVCVAFEQELKRKLLLPSERASYFIQFDLDDLQRADIVNRYNAYNTGLTAGFLTVNEIRRKENLPPVDGGDTLLRPLNMGPVNGGLVNAE